LVNISCDKGPGRGGRQSRDWEEDLEEIVELIGKNISNEILAEIFARAQP